MEFLADGSITTPPGFVAGAAACGLKKDGALDLMLFYSEHPCRAAAVFTRNQVVAAPVILDRRTLAENDSEIHAVVGNAGNANACTGAPGMRNAEAMQTVAANALGCEPRQVLVLSTGVIGVQLPMEKIKDGVSLAAGDLSAGHGQLAARAIMTTDKVPKHAAVRVELPGGLVSIGGMAKGSGMIHPDMATMFGIHTTDAVIETAVLQECLRAAVDRSYNRISIDGDTSTNDTVLILANGASGVVVDDAHSKELFQKALDTLFTYLAQEIVRDGEGASKFVEINVSGAANDRDAHKIANTIATSALVKTAFAGSDANWGRILAAAGRAGVPFKQHQTSLWVGVAQPHELQLLSGGTPTAYLERDAAAVFAEPEFKILFEIQQGSGAATVWTSDLTHDYVSINADYRT